LGANESGDWECKSTGAESSLRPEEDCCKKGRGKSPNGKDGEEKCADQESYEEGSS
jgi:hypothetical protein